MKPFSFLLPEASEPSLNVEGVLSTINLLVKLVALARIESRYVFIEVDFDKLLNSIESPNLCHWLDCTDTITSDSLVDDGVPDTLRDDAVRTRELVEVEILIMVLLEFSLDRIV